MFFEAFQSGEIALVSSHEKKRCCELDAGCVGCSGRFVLVIVDSSVAVQIDCVAQIGKEKVVVLIRLPGECLGDSRVRSIA